MGRAVHSETAVQRHDEKGSYRRAVDVRQYGPSQLLLLVRKYPEKLTVVVRKGDSSQKSDELFWSVINFICYVIIINN